ncbi:TnsA endonuclease N-terminal domain-containing protein [Cytobacillus firmus]
MNIWTEIDMEFAPKRKVSNKLSWKYPHSIGSFFSNKMNRHVEYESRGESLFYFFLELDLSTVRYYVQPVEVPIKFLDGNKDIKYWNHTPDVLVFRKTGKPVLYQIKEKEEPSKREKLINRHCREFAEKKGWEYRVIYPKTLPDTVIYNINFLNGFTRRKSQFVNLIPEVLDKLKHAQICKIEELANNFAAKVDPLFVIPVIYHLIATGFIHINILDKLSTSSVIGINGRSKTILENHLFLEG